MAAEPEKASVEGPVAATSSGAGANCSRDEQEDGSPSVAVSVEGGPRAAQQAPGAAPEGSAEPRPSAAQLGFRITGEEERYSRWLTLYDRTIRFPAHGSHPVGALTISPALVPSLSPVPVYMSRLYDGCTCLMGDPSISCTESSDRIYIPIPKTLKP